MSACHSVQAFDSVTLCASWPDWELDLALVSETFSVWHRGVTIGPAAAGYQPEEGRGKTHCLYWFLQLQLRKQNESHAITRDRVEQGNWVRHKYLFAVWFQIWEFRSGSPLKKSYFSSVKDSCGQSIASTVLNFSVNYSSVCQCIFCWTACTGCPLCAHRCTCNTRAS